MSQPASHSRVSTRAYGPIGRPLWLAVVSILCGVLTNLAWLDERMFPAAWIGMTLWIFVSLGEPPHRAFRWWLLGGLAAWGTTYHWLPQMASRHLDVNLANGLLVAVVVVTWDAFRLGVSGYLVAMLHQRGSCLALTWPVTWVALERLWPHVFPWRLGHTQIGWLSVSQVAEVVGVYGVSFLLVWGAACGAVLLRSVRESGLPHVRIRREAGLCALAIAGCAGWGCWRMNELDRLCASSESRRLALVQPGDWRDALPRLRELSRAAPDDVDLVVWGESSVGCFSQELKSFRSEAEVAASSRIGDGDQQPCPGLGRPLLCGGSSFSREPVQEEWILNTAFLIDADEMILGRYHKRILMPWGEYAVGQQWLPGLRDLLGEGQEYVAGYDPSPLRLPDQTRLGVLICYEDLSAQAAREAVCAGAQMLVNLNNLSVFGRSYALPQHQQAARFRAIENRRFLVRCGISGLTATIGPTGRVEQQADPHGPRVLVVDVALVDAKSLYTVWGDVLPMACFGALSILLFLGRFAAGYLKSVDGSPSR